MGHGVLSTDYKVTDKEDKTNTTFILKEVSSLFRYYRFLCELK